MTEPLTPPPSDVPNDPPLTPDEYLADAIARRTSAIVLMGEAAGAGLLPDVDRVMAEVAIAKLSLEIARTLPYEPFTVDMDQGAMTAEQLKKLVGIESIDAEGLRDHYLAPGRECGLAFTPVPNMPGSVRGQSYRCVVEGEHEAVAGGTLIVHRAANPDALTSDDPDITWTTRA